MDARGLRALAVSGFAALSLCDKSKCCAAPKNRIEILPWQFRNSTVPDGLLRRTLVPRRQKAIA